MLDSISLSLIGHPSAARPLKCGDFGVALSVSSRLYHSCVVVVSFAVRCRPQLSSRSVVIVSVPVPSMAIARQYECCPAPEVLPRVALGVTVVSVIRALSQSVLLYCLVEDVCCYAVRTSTTDPRKWCLSGREQSTTYGNDGKQWRYLFIQEKKRVREKISH